jgi:hypothetical protein
MKCNILHQKNLCMQWRRDRIDKLEHFSSLETHVVVCFIYSILIIPTRITETHKYQISNSTQKFLKKEHQAPCKYIYRCIRRIGLPILRKKTQRATCKQKFLVSERINLWLVEITVNNVHRRSNLLIVIIRDINCERTTIAEKK